jgi:hypothetical protein
MTTLTHFAKTHGHRFLDGKMLNFPTDNEIVEEYLSRGFQVASIFESPEGDYAQLDDDISYGFHKIGYIILEPEILFI